MRYYVVGVGFRLRGIEMSDTKTDIKPVRKSRSKPKPAEAPAAVQTADPEGFGAGIVEELEPTPPPAPEPEPESTPEPTKPVRSAGPAMRPAAPVGRTDEH